ncbi:MAG: thioredoxin domain-containing protein [Bdellovibrionales bacterium]|nr:thioredoxin domain-containing protein [Bdellovibrionales bacterium]
MTNRSIQSGSFTRAFSSADLTVGVLQRTARVIRRPLAVGSAVVLVAGALLGTDMQSAHAQDAAQADFNKKMEAFLGKEENVAKIGDALEEYFKNKRMEQQKAAEQAAQQQLEEEFKNPVDVAIGDSPVLGPKDAKVTLVEFSDFQCPFCSRAAETMKDVVKEYPKDVKLVFKHLPLPFHPQAQPAARAAVAAQRQGKFWEMHDLLFENQQNLSDELYVELAEKLGLDVAKFKKDFEDPAVAKVVEDDAALATQLGVRGTPGFFVNGVQVRGAQPLPKFKELIDRWLAEKK